MCYFVCISLPHDLPSIADIFGGEISFEIASSSPIGQAARGNRTSSVSYILTEGGCSCALVGKNHSRGKSLDKNFAKGLGMLLQKLPSISILLHTSRSNWQNELVCAREKRFASLETFCFLFPNIEEDVRYVISPYK